MNKKIGIVWLRNDFRISKNDALAYATQNYDHVCVIYIFKKKDFKKNQHNNGGFINLLKILERN